MGSLNAHLTLKKEDLNNIYAPLFFRLDNEADKEAFNGLIDTEPGIKLLDEMEGQLRELIKCINPSRPIPPDQYPDLIQKHLKRQEMNDYGVWVYYPWNNNLIHLLDEEEFVEVRTNRNRYKITRQEQETLRKKKIGIVGLSVGQSIALTLAMERTCGELRLADFDVAELSNLNRIRTGLHNMGTKKTIIAAREIAEIDPYIKVKIFNDGLHAGNMDAFFTEGGKLDLFVEVCDGLDIKIQSRFKARELHIPVVMDTNDRGMLDVERFDLDPSRPVLHGLVGDLDPQKLTSLTNEEKIPIVLQMASAQNVSKRGKASMVEVGQSISTWPQVASSVVLGGAVTTDVARRVLLGQFKDSGRYYVDLDQIIGDKDATKREATRQNPYHPLVKDELKKIVENIAAQNDTKSVTLTAEQLKDIVNAGIAAPSTGNDQPWKWYYHNNVLYMFHDMYRSFSFGDYKNIASNLTFGAVYENVTLAAHKLRLEVSAQVYPLGYSESLVFSFVFSGGEIKNAEAHKYDELVNYIYSRNTNRNLAPYKKIEDNVLAELKAAAESVNTAQLQWLTEPEKISEAGRIIGAFDKMRILNREGHNDFVAREMRWTAADAESTKDGIDIHTLGLNTSQLAALEVIKDYEVIDFIKDVKGGNVLQAATMRSVNLASAIGLITLPGKSPEQYIAGGRSLERLWLAAEKAGLALHPVISPLYFFPRLDGEDQSLSAEEMAEISLLRKQFVALFGLQEGLAEVFLFKLSYAEKPATRALRIPVEKVLFTD
jgi:molybdopterin/thiamine biosynthesis adenylyltransferase/nitroreductase